jgi:hypothetical protein
MHLSKFFKIIQKKNLAENNNKLHKKKQMKIRFNLFLNFQNKEQSISLS